MYSHTYQVLISERGGGGGGGASACAHKIQYNTQDWAYEIFVEIPGFYHEAKIRVLYIM